MIQVYSLEHALYEDPVNITRWLAEHQIDIRHIRLFEGHPLPDPEMVDLLIIMGGPMNIYEEEEFSWLAGEKQFIRAVINAGTPVLGICLGGQLIADVLGGTVNRARQPEYGWHTVTRIPGVPVFSRKETGTESILFPEVIKVFQWHQDTFSIPPGSIPLYQSELCRNQAFIYNNRVIGLQFHPEMDQPTIRGFLAQSIQEIYEKNLVNTRDDIITRIDLCSDGRIFIAGLLEYLVKFGKEKTG